MKLTNRDDEASRDSVEGDLNVLARLADAWSAVPEDRRIGLIPPPVEIVGGSNREGSLSPTQQRLRVEQLQRRIRDRLMEPVEERPLSHIGHGCCLNRHFESLSAQAPPAPGYLQGHATYEGQPSGIALQVLDLIINAAFSHGAQYGTCEMCEQDIDGYRQGTVAKAGQEAREPFLAEDVTHEAPVASETSQC